MSVVLRCPTCGTTQAHDGECEACSEGEVRYFCTNHDEGIWLDGPVCNRCAAKFGDPPRKPPAPPRAPERAPDRNGPGVAEASRREVPMSPRRCHRRHHSGSGSEITDETRPPRRRLDARAVPTRDPPSRVPERVVSADVGLALLLIIAS